MIRSRQKLGKYQIEAKLGEGGFASVFRARDTIEGVRVALKIPHPQFVNQSTLDDFRKEVRLVAQLHHPNILPLKNAEFIDGHFVVAFPLGDQSLEQRLRKRISFSLALDYTGQILEAVSFAHEHRIIHCDVKPENLILFPDNQLMLSDFGIAKVAMHTIRGSGSGTVGHVAPEQAMGRPSFGSDVFSIGLLAYRMFTGVWPEWPFDWPPDGFDRIRNRMHPDLIELLRRSMQVDPRQRFTNAAQMRSAFSRVRNRALLIEPTVKRTGTKKTRNSDWKSMRLKQFKSRYGKLLGPMAECRKCGGPVSEQMLHCPWCAESKKIFKGETSFPQVCPRCCRGLKLDWEYCPWCYGGGFETSGNRTYADSRYTARCRNSNCERKDLMPFMRYCPWCRRKVVQKWKLTPSDPACRSCGCGIAAGFWSTCPWCGDSIEANRTGS